MVNDHFVLWPWRPHKLQFNPPLILSFTAGSIIKLAWIQFRHLHFGVVLVPGPCFSLNSCISFLILSPHHAFGNPACWAGFDNYNISQFIRAKIISFYPQHYTGTWKGLLLLFPSHSWKFVSAENEMSCPRCLGKSISKPKIPGLEFTVDPWTTRKLEHQLPPLPQHTPQTDITFDELTFWNKISPV